MKPANTGPDTIAYDDFPAIFRHADGSAASHQRRFRLLVNVLVMTSAGTSLLGVISNVRLRMGFAAVLTGFQLIAALTNLSQGWNSKWYRARAIAETAKSLTWRYAVGGNPFPVGGSEQESTRDFHERMVSLTSTTASNNPLLPRYAVQENMSRIENLRKLPLDERKNAYIKFRVKDQEDWYQSRMISLGRRQNLLSGLSIACATGAVLMSMYVVGRPQQHLPAVVSFLASLSLGIVAIGQSRNLATDVAAYQVTHYEIQHLIGKLPEEEHEWAIWVDATEELFSREHTMWLGNKKTTPPALPQI